jgi:AbrB family looped-hinge helix DNA binding protein
MPSATVTSKGQITIPKEVRDGLGIGTGDRVEFVAEEKGVYRIVAATRDVRHLKGLIDKPSKPVGVEAMNRAAARAASR